MRMGEIHALHEARRPRDTREAPQIRRVPCDPCISPALLFFAGELAAIRSET